MKILLVTHVLPFPPRGGCLQRNYNLLYQVSREHEVHLVTFHRKSHLRPPETLEESIEAMRKHCPEVHVFPIPTETSRLKYYATLVSNLFSSEPYSAAIYRSKPFEAKVTEMIAKHNYDLVEIGEIGLLNYARLSGRLPKLLVHHNIESQLLYRRAKVASNPIMRAYINLQAYRTAKFEQKAGDMIDAHTVCSEIDKIVLEKINPRIKAVVVPNGVDTSLFKSTNEPIDEDHLIFVGGMGWLPNRDAMLWFKDEIWPILKKRRPNIRITVGGGSPPEELTEYSKRDENFKVTGFLREIRSLVSKATLYIVPIRVGGGTRLKILDAMALGKAIVSHPIGAEGIEVTDGQDIAIAASAEAFAETIIDLLDHPEKRIELEKNARLKAEEKYDWSKIAPSLIATYTKLVSP